MTGGQRGSALLVRNGRLLGVFGFLTPVAAGFALRRAGEHSSVEAIR